MFKEFVKRLSDLFQYLVKEFVSCLSFGSYLGIKDLIAFGSCPCSKNKVHNLVVLP